MKSKILTFFFLSFLLTLSYNSDCPAKIKAHTAEGGFSFGGMMVDSSNSSNDRYLGRLDLGVNITDLFGIELSFLNSLYSTGKVPDLTFYTISSILHIVPDATITPYFQLGGGAAYFNTDNLDNESKFTINVGGGLKYFLSENIALKFDFRNYITLNETGHNYSASLGISYLFDFSPQLAAEPLSDESKDEHIYIEKDESTPQTKEESEITEQAEIPEIITPETKVIEVQKTTYEESIETTPSTSNGSKISPPQEEKPQPEASVSHETELVMAPAAKAEITGALPVKETTITEPGRISMELPVEESPQPQAENVGTAEKPLIEGAHQVMETAKAEPRIKETAELEITMKKVVALEQIKPAITKAYPKEDKIISEAKPVGREQKTISHKEAAPETIEPSIDKVKSVAVTEKVKATSIEEETQLEETLKSMETPSKKIPEDIKPIIPEEAITYGVKPTITIEEVAAPEAKMVETHITETQPLKKLPVKEADITAPEQISSELSVEEAPRPQVEQIKTAEEPLVKKTPSVKEIIKAETAEITSVQSKTIPATAGMKLNDKCNLEISSNDQNEGLPDKKAHLTIYFPFNNSVIDSEASNCLHGRIDNLIGTEIISIIVEGHSCAHGRAYYNKQLSRRRVLTVKKFLIEKGNIPESKIKIEGFGEEKLLHPEIPTKENKDAPYVKANRRVEIKVDYK